MFDGTFKAFYDDLSNLRSGS